MRLTSAGRAAIAIAVVIVGYVVPRLRLARSAIGGDNFPDAAVALVHLVAFAIACWVLVVIAAGSLRLRLPGVPASVRTLLFTSVVMAAVASPAQAESPRDLGGLTLPDRPLSAPASTPLPEHVTVRAGDTLWAIAADHLPSDASNAAIARACAAWHTSNRAVIGPNRDLIHPGQVLQPPTTEQDAS